MSNQYEVLSGKYWSIAGTGYTRGALVTSDEDLVERFRGVFRLIGASRDAVGDDRTADFPGAAQRGVEIRQTARDEFHIFAVGTDRAIVPGPPVAANGSSRAQVQLWVDSGV